jgi:small subunit ribosomal protein S16
VGALGDQELAPQITARRAAGAADNPFGKAGRVGYNYPVRLQEEFRVLAIRLARIGKKKHPFYRVVVIEKTNPRNGRFVEIVGTYDPAKKPSVIQLKDDRVQYWLGKGAQPSDTVRSFLRNRKPS